MALICSLAPVDIRCVRLAKTRPRISVPSVAVKPWHAPGEWALRVPQLAFPAPSALGQR